MRLLSKIHLPHPPKIPSGAIGPGYITLAIVGGLAALFVIAFIIGMV